MLYRMILIVLLIALAFLLSERLTKYKASIYIVSAISCFSIIIVPVFIEKRDVRTNKAMCELNELTPESISNGNRSLSYVAGSEIFTFTDHMIVDGVCFSFDVNTFLQGSNDELRLIDEHKRSLPTLDAYHATIIKSYMGHLFITSQDIHTQLTEGILKITGSVQLESQIDKTRKIYDLNIEYEINLDQNELLKKNLSVNEQK